ncbi:MAG: nuclear transport factor 2 family protein [Minwuia sp.]|uniref:nuclear transport factor 2 family protein n=1 Tax=Minwuia sp. TaxID=2493630 RepID=UPI003A87229E
MVSTSPSLATSPADGRLDRFTGYFEGLAETDLARIGEIYTEDVHFADPFSDFRGLPTLTEIFRGMFTKMRDYRLVIDEAGMIGPDSGFVRWTMSGHVKQLGRDLWVVEGCSVIRFADDGRVREHIDYWDAASQMYERLPVIGWVLRKIRGRLAQH